MRLIIAGSRHYEAAHADRLVLDAMVDWRQAHGWPASILSGGAPGIDRAGAKWCAEHLGLHMLDPHHADWKTHGNAAGPIRNAKMAANADALLLIWDGKSKGSASMKAEAEKAGLHITEVIVEGT